jgi:hypothetical protein
MNPSTTSQFKQNMGRSRDQQVSHASAQHHTAKPPRKRIARRGKRACGLFWCSSICSDTLTCQTEERCGTATQQDSHARRTSEQSAEAMSFNRGTMGAHTQPDAHLAADFGLGRCGARLRQQLQNVLEEGSKHSSPDQICPAIRTVSRNDSSGKSHHEPDGRERNLDLAQRHHHSALVRVPAKRRWRKPRMPSPTNERTQHREC